MKLRQVSIEQWWLMGLYMNHFHLFGKTWVEKAFNDKIINTMEKLNIQQFVTSSFKDYGKPSKSLFTPLVGDGIFSQDGPQWKHSRNLIKSTFFQPEISDLTSLRVHVDRFIRLVPRDGRTIDLQGLLHKLVPNLSLAP
jgi:cytochrome P450